MSAPAKGPARLRAPLPSEDETLLPRVGKIRLGVTKSTRKNGREVTFPSAIDYFRVEHEESEITSEAAVEAFRKQYGDEPRELAIMLPGHDLDDVLENAYRLYGSSKLKIRCDGETCSERSATGGWVTKSCVCTARSLAADHRERCKRTLTIQVLLPDVSGIGVWQIDTGSEIGMRRLVGHLRLIMGIRGTLQGYECKLGLVPVKVAPDGVTKTVYVLDPRDYSQTPRQALESASQARASLDGASRLGLPAPAADEERDPLLHPVEDEGETLVQAIGRQVKALDAADQEYVRDRFSPRLREACEAILAYAEDDEVGPLLAEHLADAFKLIREREAAEVNGDDEPAPAADPDDDIPF